MTLINIRNTKVYYIAKSLVPYLAFQLALTLWKNLKSLASVPLMWLENCDLMSFGIPLGRVYSHRISNEVVVSFQHLESVSSEWMIVDGTRVLTDYFLLYEFFVHCLPWTDSFELSHH